MSTASAIGLCIGAFVVGYVFAFQLLMIRRAADSI